MGPPGRLQCRQAGRKQIGTQDTHSGDAILAVGNPYRRPRTCLAGSSWARRLLLHLATGHRAYSHAQKGQKMHYRQHVMIKSEDRSGARHGFFHAGWPPTRPKVARVLL